MGSIFKPKMPSLQPPPPAPEPPSDEISPEEKERLAKEQADLRRRKRGKKETILTCPMGIQESEEEQLESLLGKK